MFKKLSRLVLLASCFVFIVSCSGGGKTLVTINGKNITESDLDFLSTINPRLKMQLATPFGKKQILDNIVEQELLFQAATKKGLQRDAAVKAKVDLYKKVVIAQSYIETEMERSAKDYYEKNKGEFEKLQFAHVLVKFVQPEKDKKAAPKPKDKVARTKDAALKIAGDIKKRIDAGEDFAKVAKEMSEDTISKNNGGDLGRASKNEQRLERRGYGPLLEKAFAMQVGEVAGPIETQEGYHIITVIKGVEQQPFEEANQAILFKIQGDERTRLMSELKKNAKVVYADEKKKETEAKPAEAKPAEAKPAEQPVAPAPAPAKPTTK